MVSNVILWCPIIVSIKIGIIIEVPKPLEASKFLFWQLLGLFRPIFDHFFIAKALQNGHIPLLLVSNESLWCLSILLIQMYTVLSQYIVGLETWSTLKHSLGEKTKVGKDSRP